MMLVAHPIPSITEEFFDAADAPILELDGVAIEKPKWKGKGKAVVLSANERTSLPELSATPHSRNDSTPPPELSFDGVVVDFCQYEPPTGLRHKADVTSEVILQVMEESIAKVREKIAEEKEATRTSAEEDGRLPQETETRSTTNHDIFGNCENTSDRDDVGHDADWDTTLSSPVADRDRQPYTFSPGLQRQPASDVPQISPIAEKDQRPRTYLTKGVGLRLDAHGMLTLAEPSKPRRRGFMDVLRGRSKGNDRGETSAAGGLRNKFHLSSGSIDMSTHAARNSFVQNLMKRNSVDDGSMSPSSSICESEVECVSCLDDFSTKETVKGPCHSYCKACFSRLIASACEHEAHWPPKCCLNTLPEHLILANISGAQQQTYRQRATEWDIPVTERIYCHRPECSEFVRPGAVNRSQGTAQCSAGHRTCVICRGAHHGSDPCPQDRDAARTDELAEEQGWKRCVGCRAYVEHRDACQHMTCRCGAQFCYVCGATWRTCGCTMQQLADLKQNADMRCAARRDREDREAKEAAEAVRQVEEFLREEARKTELLRQEQERIAEERRRKLLEERIRQEFERRKRVAIKFEELRKILDSLHDAQLGIVRQEHDTEQDIIETKARSGQNELHSQQLEARETLIAETQSKIMNRETAYQKDYAARVVEERRIEDKFHAQLKLYWAGKEGGEETAEAALKEFKRKMDSCFAAWKKWADQALEQYRHAVQEEEAIQMEIMREIEKRLQSNMLQTQRAFAERKSADLQWVRAVIEEREKMLSNMENDEIEHGEDIDAWFADDIDADSYALELMGADQGHDQPKASERELKIPGAFV
ncbi:hypothetical protein F5Y15DRAFT_243697 [Xylariaceae sp. FL0016]|nr:hypothetical protein F5Y15DRAFT_243697 [Xylariaceae sp. FL0016]